jgi:hypothetical protein
MRPWLRPSSSAGAAQIADKRRPRALAPSRYAGPCRGARAIRVCTAIGIHGFQFSGEGELIRPARHFRLFVRLSTRLRNLRLIPCNDFALAKFFRIRDLARNHPASPLDRQFCPWPAAEQLRVDWPARSFKSLAPISLRAFLWEGKRRSSSAGSESPCARVQPRSSSTSFRAGASGA